MCIRDRQVVVGGAGADDDRLEPRLGPGGGHEERRPEGVRGCLLYTSDAADDLLCVDLGGRRIIKKKKPRIKLTSSITNTNTNDEAQLHTTY